MKIHIDIRDNIDPAIAINRVKEVIFNGHISKNGKLYCFLTQWPDGISVSVRDYRKSDCFVVYKSK